MVSVVSVMSGVLGLSSSNVLDSSLDLVSEVGTDKGEKYNHEKSTFGLAVHLSGKLGCLFPDSLKSTLSNSEDEEGKDESEETEGLDVVVDGELVSGDDIRSLGLSVGVLSINVLGRLPGMEAMED